MDLAPILILDLIKLGDLLDANQITPEMFTNLMNFYCSYMQQNMLVPGHVEKWVSLTNVNQFSLKKLPIPFFKYIAAEMGANYIDCIQC